MTLTLVGTVASVVGAIVAICQAIRASNAADAAEKARDAIVKGRKISELAQLEQRCKDAIEATQKHTLSPQNPLSRGTSLVEDKDKIQKFIGELRANQGLLVSHNENLAREYLNTIDPLFEDFNKAKDKKEICDNARLLYNHFHTFHGLLRGYLNEMREGSTK